MRMRYACREVEGTTEPAFAHSHSPRWPLDQSEYSVVKWFAFLNMRPQKGRDDHCGNEVGTLSRDIEIKPDSQPGSQLHI